VADTKDEKQRGRKAPKTNKAAPSAESVGPPVGAAAEVARTSTPVVIGGDSLLDRLRPHVKKIAVGAAALAVVLTVYFTWAWFRERSAVASTAKLSDGLASLRHPVVPPPPEPKEPKDSKEPQDEPPASQEPSFASYKEQAEATLAGLSSAGGATDSARLLEARLLLTAGKLDDAEAAYRRLSSGRSLDAVLAREGLGYVAEARAATAKDENERQRLLEATLTAFRAVQPDDKGLRRDYALYHEARILALLGKRAEARAALEKALELVPDTDLELDIQQRLAQLDATAG